jgi:hypothetical protein
MPACAAGRKRRSAAIDLFAAVTDRGDGTSYQGFSPVGPRLLLESAVMGVLAVLPLQLTSRRAMVCPIAIRNRMAVEGPAQ